MRGRCARHASPLRSLVAGAAAVLLGACESQVATGAGPAPDRAPAEVVTPAAPSEPANYGAAPGYSGGLPSLAEINIRDAALDTVLSGLDRPRAFAFIGDDEVLVTEIGGRLLRYRLGSGSVTPVSGVPEVLATHPQQGLIEVAPHPDFRRNARIYLTYVKADPNAPVYSLTALATARLDGDRLRDVETLLEAGPYSWSPANFGGAMAFGPDGHLYLSIGDRGESDPAQDGRRLQGKILRLTADGRVPADNPFVGDPDIDDRIYALGVRNAQGLDFDPASGLLFEAEHGPLGGDEVNIIRAGGNYGWPVVTYGKNYTTADIGIGTHAPGMAQPIWYWTPSIAVSPLVVYRGAMFPEWDGDLLVGALRGQKLVRLDLDGEVVRSAQAFLTELGARVRDIEVAADGSVYVLTEAGDLHRLHRRTAGAPAAGGLIPPAELYRVVCAGCHDTGAYGAPNPMVAGALDAARAAPREQAWRRTIEGHGRMPARGLCDVCTDDHIRSIVDWMLDEAPGSGAGDAANPDGAAD